MSQGMMGTPIGAATVDPATTPAAEEVRNVANRRLMELREMVAKIETNQAILDMDKHNALNEMALLEGVISASINSLKMNHQSVPTIPQTGGDPFTQTFSPFTVGAGGGPR